MNLMRSAFALALLAVAGCAANPVTGEQDLVLMSEEQEIAIGRKSHAEVIEKYGRYDDAKLNAYVDRLGKRIAEKSHRSGLIYRFTILDTDEVNAFALPGGYIYVTRGLLAYLNSEAELAAVLGHELGHVTARHSVRQHATATVTGIVGAVIAGASGVQGAGDIANVVGTAVTRGYGRAHELEADRLGAEYLARTGYDPQAMMEVIKVLKSQEGFERERAKKEGRDANVYHGVFATHPDNDERLKEVVAAAEKFRTAETVRIDREAFVRRLDGLAFGPSSREGVTRGRNFYHAELDFAVTAPEGWRLENLPDRIEMTAPKGEGLLQLTVEDVNRRITPRQFMLERMKLRNLSHEEGFTHQGLTGHTAIAPVATSWGRRDGRFVVIYHHDRAFVFRAATKSAKTPYRFDDAFLAVAKSFHALTDAERGDAQPHRLKVRKATQRDRLAALAKKSPVAPYPEEQLRLLNALYPKGEPTPGSLIKVVE